MCCFIFLKRYTYISDKICARYTANDGFLFFLTIYEMFTF